MESVIEEMAGAPLSLKYLCRQVVSHSLGAYPGRQARFQALAIPAAVKSFLSYDEFHVPEEEGMNVDDDDNDENDFDVDINSDDSGHAGCILS